MNGILQEVKEQRHLSAEILTGQAALHCIADEAFQVAWDALYESCPWATTFQSRAFVSTWYRFYQYDYQPVLIKASSAGKLCGLLTLARTSKGMLIGAGANQAEYQVWLAIPEAAEAFIHSAFTRLREKFPNSSINLKYLPSNTPLNWLQSEATWQKSSFLRPARQPLLIIDKDDIALELRKKNRREKINRLKRLGELKFERVTDSQMFDAVLQELTIQSDFRKGAMFNKTVFQDEPIRQEFLRSLFQQGLLHTTLLKLGQTIIASNVGAMGKNWVHLQGINTHSPTLAKHSPGILHFLMLGNMLAEEGIEVFDLTPGTDPYKEILATNHTTAYELTVDRAAKVYAKKLQHRANVYLKTKLPEVGLDLKAINRLKYNFSLLTEKSKLLQKNGIKPLLQLLKSGQSSGRQQLLFRLEQQLHQTNQAFQLNKDSLSDLLHYKPDGSLTTKWEFLLQAMKRFENGQHVYTWREGEMLLGCAWTSEHKAARPGSLPAVQVPDEAILLDSFYLHSTAYASSQAFLTGIAALAAQQTAIPVYALSASSDKRLVTALQQSGFQPMKTNHQESTGGDGTRSS